MWKNTALLILVISLILVAFSPNVSAKTDTVTLKYYTIWFLNIEVDRSLTVNVGGNTYFAPSTQNVTAYLPIGNYTFTCEYGNSPATCATSYFVVTDHNEEVTAWPLCSDPNWSCTGVNDPTYMASPIFYNVFMSFIIIVPVALVTGLTYEAWKYFDRRKRR
jgi:hypothetical protein